jgi:predicted enzyme related to lactoylglutathione lyase
MTHNTVEWFEVATDRPEEAKRFYGELFGWTYRGADRYAEVNTPGTPGPSGGVFDTRGEFPGYAIFYVTVEDVPATLAKAEALGGKTLVPPTTTPDGLVFAQLRDATGNHFGVFSPPTEA